jgi:hypothetical protein
MMFSSNPATLDDFIHSATRWQTLLDDLNAKIAESQSQVELPGSHIRTPGLAMKNTGSTESLRPENPTQNTCLAGSDAIINVEDADAKYYDHAAPPIGNCTHFIAPSSFVSKIATSQISRMHLQQPTEINFKIKGRPALFWANKRQNIKPEL